MCVRKKSLVLHFAGFNPVVLNRDILVQNNKIGKNPAKTWRTEVRMRKTKIVCTLGPSTDNEEVLRQMMLERDGHTIYSFKNIM